jgi:orotate phosphoribosyltransferase-like protein
MTDLLTIDEVAERLRVSVLTVRWLRQEGRFTLRSRSAAAWYGMPAT